MRGQARARQVMSGRIDDCDSTRVVCDIYLFPGLGSMWRTAGSVAGTNSHQPLCVVRVTTAVTSANGLMPHVHIHLAFLLFSDTSFLEYSLCPGSVGASCSLQARAHRFCRRVSVGGVIIDCHEWGSGIRRTLPCWLPAGWLPV